MPEPEGNDHPGDEPTGSVRCPWCSTASPSGTTTCPSCGASLVATGDASVPGVTAIDPAAVLRSRTAPKSRGLLGFLSGEGGDAVEVPSQAELERLAPPAADVRMEIMRLELEAARGRLEAEAAALAAEAAADEPAIGEPASEATTVVTAEPSAELTPPSEVPPGP